MAVDWPRMFTLALAAGTLATQMWSWRRTRPRGHRRSLWVGFAVLVFGIGFGVVEVMAHSGTEYRLMLVCTGLAWIGWGFILEGRSHSPPPRPSRGRRP